MIHFRFLSAEEPGVFKQKQIISNYTKHKKTRLFFLFTFLFVAGVHGQNILNKKISINVSQKKLPEILQAIDFKGHFMTGGDSLFIATCRHELRNIAHGSGKFARAVQGLESR